MHWPLSLLWSLTHPKEAENIRCLSGLSAATHNVIDNHILRFLAHTHQFVSEKLAEFGHIPTRRRISGQQANAITRVRFAHSAVQ